MNSLRSILHIIDMISEWSGRIFAFLVIPIIIIVGYGVVMRYVFNAPISWSYEVSLYLYFVQLVIAGAYGLLHRDHVKMDLIYDQLSRRKKAIIDSITAVACFFMIGLILWQGTKMGWRSYVLQERSPSVNMFPVWPMKAAIPISAFLLLLQGAANFIRNIYFAIRGKEM